MLWDSVLGKRLEKLSWEVAGAWKLLLCCQHHIEFCTPFQFQCAHSLQFQFPLSFPPILCNIVPSRPNTLLFPSNLTRYHSLNCSACGRHTNPTRFAVTHRFTSIHVEQPSWPRSVPSIQLDKSLDLQGWLVSHESRRLIPLDGWHRP